MTAIFVVNKMMYYCEILPNHVFVVKAFATLTMDHCCYSSLEQSIVDLCVHTQHAQPMNGLLEKGHTGRVETASRAQQKGMNFQDLFPMPSQSTAASLKSQHPQILKKLLVMV